MVQTSSELLRLARSKGIVYVDPRIDYAFKLLFGTPGNEDLLLRLVQAILPEKHIAAVELTAQEQVGPRPDVRRSVIDVKCKTDDGSDLIIEMQIKEQEDFTDRMVFYSSFPIINRLLGYLKDGTVLCGGRYDRERRWIEPTLLGDVSPDAPVMQEEIFGPIFPVLTFRDLDEVQAFVTAREKPLAFYYFGSAKDAWQLIGHTTSGGACINDTIMHVANSRLPFGGVGNSGMGSYHSERSFLAFTHERAVLKTPTRLDPKFRYMPYKLFPLIERMLRP